MAVLAAVDALRHQGEGPAYERHLATIGMGQGARRPAELVATTARVLDNLLHRSIESAWELGWQPADVERVVRRRLGARHAGAVASAMANELRRYAAATVDPAWRAQFRGMGADPWDPAAPEGPDRGGGRLPLDLRPAESAGIVDDVPGHRAAVAVLSVLLGLPELPRLGPRPGRARTVSGRSATGGRVGGRVDGRVLERVRAMLAKAESTTFAEEAEAFTAKAQELMARHAVDRAMVDGARQSGATAGRRIGVDDPYAQPKSLLLSVVASANRCRSVWSGELGFSTVFGHGPDLDGVELLYTSLLVQATAAMAAAGSQVDRYGRSRTRSFRSSFLAAYAQRIGQRLRECTEAAEAAGAAEHGAGLLPVLAALDQEVEDAVKAVFPEMRRFSVAASNRAGWVAGTAAAQLAVLSPNEELRPRAMA